MSKRLKKLVIGIYSLVIVLIGAGLYMVLQQDKPLPAAVPEEVVGAELDPDVLAVLSDMDGGSDVTVPIQDLEKLLPEKVDPAWRQYAVAWKDTNLPRIAIVIDDLGLNYQATEELAEMPGPYTLAYLPYAEHLEYQTGRVHAAGHELMVHLPMQPKGSAADPGTNALLAGLGPDEFQRRLIWNLSRFDGFVGVNNHMGSLLTEDAGHMVQVMTYLKADGYLFLDSLTSPKSVGMSAAKATGVPTIARDIFLDNIQHRDAIEAQLAKAERIARVRGYSIAIGHPYQVTLETLKEWQKTLRAKGIALVPISQLVGTLEARRQHAEVMTEDAMGGQARD
ncbi:divergent polysaccharide deacetylase family protein [Kordiimonas lipolytica]|uniref:Divergent polysaccharide deacetylase family protein n=1 Tax=Kordiimonas lipolytica TaxID=1662421 RepID=A0ABV8U9Y6_9PROT|nr:divergent polysaccharide deacetylase family protein [Kordiimonas lipolytica]